MNVNFIYCWCFIFSLLNIFLIPSSSISFSIISIVLGVTWIIYMVKAVIRKNAAYPIHNKDLLFLAIAHSVKFPAKDNSHVSIMDILLLCRKVFILVHNTKKHYFYDRCLANDNKNLSDAVETLSRICVYFELNIREIIVENQNYVRVDMDNPRGLTFAWKDNKFQIEVA